MNTVSKPLMRIDLDHILHHTTNLWTHLRNQRIFLSGGTGFFGCWLLESFAYANKELQLNATLVVLTRDIKAFAKKCPHLMLDTSIIFYQGDVRNFEYPSGPFDYMIHAATEASASLNPLLMEDTIIQGTQHMLEFAREMKTKRFLFISSGAVYGKQPAHITQMYEDYVVCSDKEEETLFAYAKGKRKAEQLCEEYAHLYNLDIKIARCFAFCGPHLPLDTHFAIGNFIRDGLSGDLITIQSDGTSCRSYMYPSDLIIWLLTILISGKVAYPYNVGSDEAYTIYDIAKLVSNSFTHKPTVQRMKTPLAGASSDRYIPDISRAYQELGLKPQITITEAIKSTIDWYRK